MKHKRYTEEQIISVSKEHEAGAPVPEGTRPQPPSIIPLACVPGREL